MRQFLAVLGHGFAVAGSGMAEMPPRYPWQRRIDNRPPVPSAKLGIDGEPNLSPRSRLCSWLPLVGLTATPLCLGYWLARRNLSSSQ